MIIDKLKNAKKYYNLNENIKKGLEFLENTDLKNIECKKHIIDNEKIWCNVQELNTKNPATTPWEIHQRYTDIQYVITGAECMHWTNLENFMPTTEFDKENDIQFGEIKENSTSASLIVNEGYFVIFTPEDVHKPALMINEEKLVKKIIVKIEN